MLGGAEPWVCKTSSHGLENASLLNKNTIWISNTKTQNISRERQSEELLHYLSHPNSHWCSVLGTPYMSIVWSLNTFRILLNTFWILLDHGHGATNTGMARRWEGRSLFCDFLFRRSHWREQWSRLRSEKGIKL